MEFDSFRFGERRRGGVCFYNLRAMFSCQMRWTPSQVSQLTRGAGNLTSKLPISHSFITIYPGSATVQGLLSQRQSWGTRYRRLGRPISSKVSTSWCVFIFCNKFIFCSKFIFCTSFDLLTLQPHLGRCLCWDAWAALSWNGERSRWERFKVRDMKISEDGEIRKRDRGKILKLKLWQGNMKNYVE